MHEFAEIIETLLYPPEARINLIQPLISLVQTLIKVLSQLFDAVSDLLQDLGGKVGSHTF